MLCLYFYFLYVLFLYVVQFIKFILQKAPNVGLERRYAVMEIKACGITHHNHIRNVDIRN